VDKHGRCSARCNRSSGRRPTASTRCAGGISQSRKVGRAHSASRRYKQTAHPLKSSFGTITVRNPIHPLCGHTLPLRNIRRVGELLEYIVEHPDGGVLTLPAWATDVMPQVPPPCCHGRIPLLHPAQLVRLVHRLRTLKTCPSSADKQGVALWEATPLPQDTRDDATRHSAATTAAGPLDHTSALDPSHGTAHRPPPPPAGQAHTRRPGGCV
jgi:hypothetical protein